MFRIGKQKLKTYVNGVETKVHSLDVKQKKSKKKSAADSLTSPYPPTKLNFTLNGSRNLGNLIIYHNNCASLCYKNMITGKQISLQVLGSSCVASTATKKFSRPLQCRNVRNKVSNEMMANSFKPLTETTFHRPKGKIAFVKEYNKTLAVTGETKLKSNINRTTRPTPVPIPAVKTTKAITYSKATQGKENDSTETAKSSVSFIEKTKTSVKVTITDQMVKDKQEDQRVLRLKEEEDSKNDKMQLIDADKAQQYRSKKGKYRVNKEEEIECNSASVPVNISSQSEMKKDRLHLRVVLPRVCNETEL